MVSTEMLTMGLRGFYRDQVRDRNGRTTWDSGVRRNTIVDDCRRLLAGFMRGAPTATLGIQGLQVGAGNAAWDLPPGAPPAGRTQTQLVDPSPYTVLRAQLQLDFLTGATVTATPTNRLQIIADLGPGVPSWPDGAHASATLREFGLVAELNGTDVLLDYIRHPAIAKDASSTLTRTIWLVF